MMEVIKAPDVNKRLKELQVDPSGNTVRGVQAAGGGRAAALGGHRQGRQHQARLDGPGPQTPACAGRPPADRRRRAAGVAAAARDRASLRQPRHRLPAHRGGLRARQGERGGGAARRAGAAREPGRGHGARRLSGDGRAAGGDGARQRRHRQHRQHARRRQPRPRAAAADGGALADHGGRARSGRATGRSTGRRRCSTRPAWCASSSSGTTSCATRRRRSGWWRARVEAATASPSGPVYLTLPREPLSAPVRGEPRCRRAARRAVDAASRSGGHRAPGGLDRRGEAAAGHCLQRGPGAGGGRDAGPDRRALQAAGRRPDAALSVPGDRPSHACGLRSGAVPGRGRPHPGRRVRRPLDAGRQGAEPQGAHRPHRRGPGVPALSHAQLPQRPVDRRRRRRRRWRPWKRRWRSADARRGRAAGGQRRRTGVTAPMRRTSRRNT